MGTRATITFYEDGEKLVKLYNHWDGYIAGLGVELAEWLNNKTIINGITKRDDESKANGIGCLVAQFIRDHKTCIGDLYVIPIDSDDEMIDYQYKVEFTDSIGKCSEIAKITVTTWGSENIEFVGTPSELLKERWSDDY